MGYPQTGTHVGTRQIVQWYPPYCYEDGIHQTQSDSDQNLILFHFIYSRHFTICINIIQRISIVQTLNRVPIEENLYEDLDGSSGDGGKRFPTKGHLEDPSNAWCSATT